MFEAIMENIRRADTVILHRHTNPDGDALGSQIGKPALPSMIMESVEIMSAHNAAKISHIAVACRKFRLKERKYDFTIYPSSSLTILSST